MEEETKNNKRTNLEEIMESDGNGPKKKQKVTEKVVRKPFNREEWENQQKLKGPITVQNMSSRKITVLNKSFTDYYKVQFVLNKLMDEEEYEKFLEMLKLELPTTFRITSRGGLTVPLKEKLQTTYFSNDGLKTLKVNEEVTLKVDSPKEIDWYFPQGLAYHYAVNKLGLNKTPFLKQFKSFITTEQNAGNLARQESVSMVPALLLDVKPHHVVLDMCAAPGSKTGQLIELLHYGLPEGEIPSGMIVANDVNIARCYLLTHIVQRLGSPCYMVVNYQAQNFPDLIINDEPVTFDSILCDVPCSGDGTIRKTPSAGQKWNNKHAIALHPLQLLIASRAVELLKTGGTLVFTSNDKEVVEWDEVNFGQGKSPILKTMFPSKDELLSSQLKKCIRLFPHHQDTGGFFITVFRKINPHVPVKINNNINNNSSSTEIVEEIKEENNDNNKIDIDNSITNLNPNSKKKLSLYPGQKGYEWKEDPFISISDDSQDALNNFYDIFGIDKELPSMKNLMRRGTGERQKIYLFNELTKNIVNIPGLRIINAGLRLALNEQSKNKKLELTSRWRVANESLPYLIHFISKRILEINIIDFFLLLISNQPLLITEIFDENVKSQIKSLEIGSFISQVKGTNNISVSDIANKLSSLPDSPMKPFLQKIIDDVDLNEISNLLTSPLSFVVWRGTTSITLHISKIEKDSLRNIFLGRYGVYKNIDERHWTCLDHGVKNDNGEDNDIIIEDL